jgi:hypothetical protein
MSGRSGWLRNAEAVMLRAMTKDSLDAFLASFKRKRTVADVIASETWAFKDAKGKNQRARIEIGRPQQVPKDAHGDWFCPVFIEGWMSHVFPAMGVGAVDSLMNGVAVVQAFQGEISSIVISTERPKVRRGTR